MLSGIYLVAFLADSHRFGEGLVVISDGAVNGGDATYLYRGHFDQYGDDMKGTIEVRHYRGPFNGVLGPMKQFTLSLSGKVVGDNFSATGGIPNIPNATITITGTKVADLSS